MTFQLFKGDSFCEKELCVKWSVKNRDMHSKISIYKYCFLLVFAGFQIGYGAFPDTSGQGYAVKISALITPQKVPLNTTATLTVQLICEGALDSIQVFPIEEPVLTNLEIIGTASGDRVIGGGSGKQSIREMIYTLRPKSLGMAYVESVRIQYEDKTAKALRELHTPRLAVEIVEPIPERKGKSLVWLLPLGTAFLLLGIFLGIRRLRREKTSLPPPEEKPLLEERFLFELKAIREKASQNLSEAFSLLSKLFRKYLSEKFHVSALETSTSELLASLGGLDIKEEQVRQIEAFFTKADVIQYSGQSISQTEFDEAYTRVESVIESHLMEEKARIQKEKEMRLQSQKKQYGLFRLRRRHE